MPLAVLALLISFATACSGSAGPVVESGTGSARPAGRVVDHVPDPIDVRARYLFYLHNQFAESAEPGEVHPVYGPYDLDGILSAFAERRFTVVAPRRGPDADPTMWAQRVSSMITQLLVAGVPPEKITVVGFSKGGTIAILVSSELANDDVNYVFLASCGPWIRAAEGLEPRGRLLSIFESSDRVAGSCSELFSMASGDTESAEIEIRIGGGHGAFFTPHAAWLQPTVEWALVLRPTEDPFAKPLR